jgi:isopenicillin N synthase-like dioxygenase
VRIEERQQIADQIREGATTIRFFYMQGHQISDSVIYTAIKVSKEFFHQPDEIKERVNQKYSTG